MKQRNDAQGTKNIKAYRNLKRNATLPLRLAESERFGSLANRFRIAKILKLGVEWAYRNQLNDQYYKIILENYVDGSKSWESCRTALEGFYRACREKKTHFVFALFPVYPMEPEQTFNDYPDGLKKVHEKLKSVFSGRDGVTVVDTLDDLAANGLTTRGVDCIDRPTPERKMA